MTTLHISICTCIEVAPIFAPSHVKTSFAPKPCQHLWSHVKTSFAPKPCRHSWSHVKTSFALKSCQHSWDHEVTPTFHISTEVMPILVFSMKPRQHFICIETMPTFMKAWSYFKTSFAPKLCQHSWSHNNIPISTCTCIEVAPIF